MSEPLSEANHQQNSFVKSDSVPLAVADQNDILGALCFLIFRYTGKQSVSVLHLTNGTTSFRVWDITESTRLESLTTQFHEEVAGLINDSEDNDLSIWNPMFIVPESENQFNASLSEVITNGFIVDIAFSYSKSGLQVFSSKKPHSREFLNQIANHWKHAIELITNQPDSTVFDLPILTDLEHQEMIVDWNDNDKPVEDGKFGFEDFDTQVQINPDRVAISDGDEKVSYIQLQAQANRLAHYLQSIGIGPEVVVGIYLTRSIEFVVALVGLKKSGGGFLPLDPDHPKDRKNYLITDSQVPFIITSRQWKDSLPPGNYRLIVLEELEDVLPKFPTETPHHGLVSGSMSQLFYTSGSTGKPKGVIMTLEYKEKKEPKPRSNNQGNKVLLKSSTGFTLILLEAFVPLQTGGEVVVVPKDKDKDAQWLIDNIQKQEVQTLNLVPSMLSLLLLQDDISKCTTLEKVFTVGERLPVAVQRDFFKKLPHARLFVFYGCTEAPAATFREIDPLEDYGDKVVLGKPMINKRIYILDKQGVPVPKGVAGELFVGGSISRGYFNNDALTNERFLPNPFLETDDERVYQTGDLGRFLEDGSIEYLGRTDFQVQIRGIRIELGEIEASLIAHPLVNDTIILAHKSTSGNTFLVAYFTLKGDGFPNSDELRTYLRKQLPDYMIPARFIPLDEFPINTSGKIDRLRFPHPESVTVSVDGNAVFEGYSTTQTAIRRIIFDTLGISQLLNSESLFDIGGDSLSAVIVTNELNREFGIQLNMTDLFENPSVFELEKLVETSGYKSPFDLLVKVRTGVGQQNLFMFTVNVSVNAHVSRDFDIYILRGLWFNNHFDFSVLISEIVEDYVREVLLIQHEGPFYLAGFSMGGTIAHQVACRLQSLGHEVRGLYLADPSAKLPDTDNVPRSNSSALLQHLRKRGLSEGPGIICSYLLNLFKIPILPKHRDRIAFIYTKTLICASPFEVFHGDAHVYHCTGYESDELASWKSLVDGELVFRQLDTTDHHAVDRTPIQKVWCEAIKP